MSKFDDLALEDLLAGPLDEVEAKPTDSEGQPIEFTPVDDDELAEATDGALEDNFTVERALLFARLTLESVDYQIAHTQEGLPMDMHHHTGIEKMFSAISEGAKRLVEAIVKFFFKITNYIRASGLEKKFGIIKNSSFDEAKIDKNKLVVNPDVITEILKLKGFKIPEGFWAGVIEKFVGVDPTVIRANVEHLLEEKVHLSDAVHKSVKLCNMNVLDAFTTTIKEITKEAKNAQRRVEVLKTSLAENDAEKLRNIAGHSRAALKRISDATYLGIRGFSWYITAVNYTLHSVVEHDAVDDMVSALTFGAVSRPKVKTH